MRVFMCVCLCVFFWPAIGQKLPNLKSFFFKGVGGGPK